LLLSFPIWGTVAFVGVFTHLPPTTNVPQNLPLVVALLAPVIGAIPILTAKRVPVLGKIVLVPLYYAASLVVIFVLGWGAVCIFQSCH